jgi:hypothetical protein
MRTLIVSSALTLFATVLSGQDLVAPADWQQIAPSYQLNYSNTPGGISFNPYCVGANCASVRTGITQVVEVPSPGLYQFRFRGHGGSTGNFKTQFAVGSLTEQMQYGTWHVTRTLFLQKGPVTISITTDTSNMTVDRWTCWQPSLMPVLAPAVDHTAANAGDPWNVMVVVSTPGQILAGSLAVPAAPIRIPGLSHGLDLSPGSMVILGVSTSGGVHVDLTGAARSLGYKTWPPFHVQAVSSTGFGSRSWF